MTRISTKRCAIAATTVALAMGIGALVPDVAAQRLRRARPPASRFDPVAFNARVAQNRSRIAAMKERLARERAARGETDDPRTRDKYYVAPEERAAHMVDMLDPCFFGTPDVCEQLLDVVHDCGMGDSQSCIAAAQFVEDTPPHALFGRAYWVYGCKLGDPQACIRLEQLKVRPENCSDDKFACAWASYRTKDVTRYGELCDLGVGDGCTLKAHALLESDPEQTFTLIERGCSLGLSFACAAVGDMLSRDCVQEDETDLPCFDPDPARSAAAYRIACEAGETHYCR